MRAFGTLEFMPRGRRYIVAGHTYHVTHRCHGRSFFFRYGTDRTVYRAMLRDRLKRFNLSLFSYCITSNHVHLLVRPEPSEALESLSGFMQSLEGDFAQYYNRKWKRENAFWGDRYHATMVESGAHLWRCLLYIDLNMVRAGVVKHPSDWEWTAYRELSGLRQRYRLVDHEALLVQLGDIHKDYFIEHYIRRVQEALEQEAMLRDGKWTESLAVGSESYVRKVGAAVPNRMGIEVFEDASESSSWVVKESMGEYA